MLAKVMVQDLEPAKSLQAALVAVEQGSWRSVAAFEGGELLTDRFGDRVGLMFGQIRKQAGLTPISLGVES